MSPTDGAEVAIVGGGPAGASLAIRLAGQGVDVALFERLAAPRWRACGVYSSSLTRRRLRDLGVSADQLGALIRPIDAMEVRSVRGPGCRLDYGDAEPACGIDRVRLERALLDRAIAAGARIHEGAAVIEVTPGRLIVSLDGERRAVAASLIVGADGPSSLVARAHGVARHVRRLRHAGLTAHRADPSASLPGAPMIGRMVIGDGWYLGIAPVPGARVNLGLVVAERRLRERIARGMRPGDILTDTAGRLSGPPEAWQAGSYEDAVCVALPLAHRVSRRSGPGFLLIGDACGFIDPLSGDGIHRALVSAELAADGIAGWRRGSGAALERYDRRLRGRFLPKDLISWILQIFLARPGAMDYALRRLASRDSLRRTLGDVLADLEPPGRALDPRFVVGLLRP